MANDREQQALMKDIKGYIDAANMWFEMSVKDNSKFFYDMGNAQLQSAKILLKVLADEGFK